MNFTQSAVWRRRLRLCVITTLTAVAAASAAVDDAPAADTPVIDPDPALQKVIATVMSPSDQRQQDSALDQLRTLGDAEPERLVRQSVYYSTQAATTRDAMAAGVIIRRLNVSDSDVITALIPLLETTGEKLGQSVRNILSGYEGRSAGRRPDFSAYRQMIADSVREGGEPPAGLIRYLYESDPGEAMLTVMRAHRLKDPAEIKPLIWAEHVVAEVLWKQQYGFLSRNQIEPEAGKELAHLAQHRAWWLRLYVAEIMRQRPAFRQPALVRLLESDPNPSVVRAIAAIEQTSRD
ncbi:MAG: hypothetical protein GY778_11090 [bacterium]|nr:hypothetical protein [bacterium]